jgi:hypothetical protein
MSIFDLDLKWPIIDLLYAKGATRSWFFAPLKTDESLWIFWQNKVEACVSSEMEIRRYSLQLRRHVDFLQCSLVVKITEDCEYLAKTDDDHAEIGLKTKAEAVQFIAKFIDVALGIEIKE